MSAYYSFYSHIINPEDTWILLRKLVPGKSKQNKCNFQNLTVSASTFNDFFATGGEKTYNEMKHRHQTNGFDVQARHETPVWSPMGPTPMGTPHCGVPIRSSGIVILAISKLKNNQMGMIKLIFNLSKKVEWLQSHILN